MIKRNILNTDIRMHENNNGLVRTNRIINNLNKEIFDIKGNTALIQADVMSFKSDNSHQNSRMLSNNTFLSARQIDPQFNF